MAVRIPVKKILKEVSHDVEPKFIVWRGSDGLYYYRRADSRGVKASENFNELMSMIFAEKSATNSSAAHIRLRPGTYEITNTLRLPENIKHIIIEGSGPSTVLKAPFGGGCTQMIEGGGEDWTEIRIFRNFKIDRRGVGTKLELINAGGAGYVEFNGLTIYDDRRTGGCDFAIGGYNSIVAIARHNKIYSKSYGIWLFGYLTHIYDNYVEDTSDVGIVGAGMIYTEGFASWLRIPEGFSVGGLVTIENNVCVDCGQTDEAISIDYMVDGWIGDGIGVIRNNIIESRNATMNHPITIIKARHAIVYGNVIRGKVKGDIIGSYGFTTGEPGSSKNIDILNNVFRVELDKPNSARAMFVVAPEHITFENNDVNITIPYTTTGGEVISLLTNFINVSNNRINITSTVESAGGFGRVFAIDPTEVDNRFATVIITGNRILAEKHDIWEGTVDIRLYRPYIPRATVVFKDNTIYMKSWWRAFTLSIGGEYTGDVDLIITGNVSTSTIALIRNGRTEANTVHITAEPPLVPSFSGPLNILYRQRNGGTATIPAGSTRITVEHRLIATPSKVILTPHSNIRVWVENVTTSSFDIVTDNAPSTNVQVTWLAEI
mgnify:CR=1 FL=1